MKTGHRWRRVSYDSYSYGSGNDVNFVHGTKATWACTRCNSVIQFNGRRPLKRRDTKRIDKCKNVRITKMVMEEDFHENRP